MGGRKPYRDGWRSHSDEPEGSRWHTLGEYEAEQLRVLNRRRRLQEAGLLTSREELLLEREEQKVQEGSGGRRDDIG